MLCHPLLVGPENNTAGRFLDTIMRDRFCCCVLWLSTFPDASIFLWLKHSQLNRFTLALSVPLPDTAGREDIISRQLQQHCREHSLKEGAVEAALTEVSLNIDNISLH